MRGRPLSSRAHSPPWHQHTRHTHPQPDSHAAAAAQLTRALHARLDANGARRALVEPQRPRQRVPKRITCTHAACRQATSSAAAAAAARRRAGTHRQRAQIHLPPPPPRTPPHTHRVRQQRTGPVQQRHWDAGRQPRGTQHGGHLRHRDYTGGGRGAGGGGRTSAPANQPPAVTRSPTLPSPPPPHTQHMRGGALTRAQHHRQRQGQQRQGGAHRVHACLEQLVDD